MNTILFGLLFIVLAVHGMVNGQLAYASTTKPDCSAYCYNLVRPMVNVTMNLQKKVSDLQHQVECSKKLETTNQLIQSKFDEQDKKIEQQFHDVSIATESILQQFQQRGQQIEQQLANLYKIAEASKPTVGYPYRLIGSKYYYIEESEEVNWFEAVHRCLALDGHLASIKNEDEFNAITEQLPADKHYWLDFSDLGKEGEFVSIATGQKITYFNWHGNEPNNGGGVEHCGELWYTDDKHLMNDAKCNYEELFICEPKNQF